MRCTHIFDSEFIIDWLTDDSFIYSLTERLGVWDERGKKSRWWSRTSQPQKSGKTHIVMSSEKREKGGSPGPDLPREPPLPSAQFQRIVLERVSAWVLSTVLLACWARAFLVVEAYLWAIWCLAMSLASTCYILIVSLPLVVSKKNVSTHCQMFPGGQNCSPLKATGLTEINS